MTKKRIYIFGAVILLVITATFFHAQQVWPVQPKDLVGVYRNPKNLKDVIYLRADANYEHDTGAEKYFGKWSVNKWNGDVSLVSIQFDDRTEFNTPYIVGSRFGRVENLYITNKSDEEWRKTEK